MRNRKNPYTFYDFIDTATMHSDEKDILARGLANFEKEIYEETDVPQEGYWGIRSSLEDEQNMIFVAYREGANPLSGPFLAYCRVEAMDFEELDVVEMIEDGDIDLDDLTQDQKDILENHEDHTFVYVADIARLRTDEAKKEYDEMMARLFQVFLERNYIVEAQVRPDTSYKLLKRLEKQGILKFLVDEYMEHYYDYGEHAHYIIIAKND